MLKKIAFFAGSVLFAANLMAAEPAKAPHVLISTTNGDIEIELDPVKAPISTKNFLAYVDKGFYTNTIFHRVIPGFMVQGGGFTAQMAQKTPKPPIKNEASNGLHNVRGTLSMARTNEPELGHQPVLHQRRGQCLPRSRPRCRLCRVRQSGQGHGRGRHHRQLANHHQTGHAERANRSCPDQVGQAHRLRSSR